MAEAPDQAPADQGGGAQGDGASAGVGSRLLDLLFQALPAIAGAVGFVGFVAVLGAAIDWVRFDAAGLPADQAVRVVDRHELIATGAVSLIVFTLLGLIAVLAAYLLDPKAEGNRSLSIGAVVVALAELLYVLLFIGAAWWTWALVVIGVPVLAWLGYVLFVEVGRGRSWRRLLDELLAARREVALAERASSNAGDDAAADERASARLITADDRFVALARDAYRRLGVPAPQALDAATGRIRTSAREATRVTEVAPDVVARVHTRVEERPGPAITGRALGALLGIVVLLAVGVLLALLVDDARWIGGMVAFVVVLNLVVYGVARASNRFVWYGIAVFVSVPLFAAVFGAVRTWRYPKLQPVALIRKSSDRAICGLYIAENDQRIYLARVELASPNAQRAEPGSGRLFWVPLSDVDMIKIGQMQPIRDANGRAPLLAQELYADRAEAAPATVDPVTTTVEQDGPGATKRTTVSERAVDPSAPKPRPVPVPPITSCTYTSLRTPIASARTGWAVDPKDP